jgi:hypothetical protein
VVGRISIFQSGEFKNSQRQNFLKARSINELVLVLVRGIASAKAGFDNF